MPLAPADQREILVPLAAWQRKSRPGSKPGRLLCRDRVAGG
jgi:hypothetical protein